MARLEHAGRARRARRIAQPARARPAGGADRRATREERRRTRTASRALEFIPLTWRRHRPAPPPHLPCSIITWEVGERAGAAAVSVSLKRPTIDKGFWARSEEHTSELQSLNG